MPSSVRGLKGELLGRWRYRSLAIHSSSLTMNARLAVLRPATVLCALVSLACTSADSRREEGLAGGWHIEQVPRLDVGDREDGDSMVFGGVLDARLLPNGTLAVADGGAFAVHFFDARGQKLRTVGRRGRGPAEFTGGMQFMDAAGDSLAVWDPGQTRWTFLSSTDGGARQLIEPIPTPVWVHAGVEIHSAVAQPPEWMLARLASLVAAGTDVRLARLDATGVLWVRGEPSVTEWRAYVDTTASVGAITLPADERLLHITRDAVVALRSDSLGLERVVVHALSRGAHRAPALTPTAIADDDVVMRDQLRAAMRGAVMAQEMNWMKNESYTAAVDSLTLEMPQGTRLRIIEATKRGWRGVGYYTATGYSCGMIIGLTIPAGWTEGEVRCGW
jgi:hypothetical protein